ncbi:MAG: glycine hydroxymethyltransferase, partial [Opitutales bacterium]|nr:glycine hydroxymethyltransferase [Opitutales bacterium]
AKVVENSKTMAQAMIDEGLKICTGGSDNHLLLIDVTGFGLNGRQAEAAVRECGITLNRNSLPFDVNGPHYTSGLRVGSPAVTSLGMGVEQMKEIAAIFKLILSNTTPKILNKGKNTGQQSKVKYDIAEGVVEEGKRRVMALLETFVLYPELDLEFLKSHFGS